MQHYLAIDLGAESGRAMLGTLSAGKLALEELHRFPNTPVRALGALYWDTLRLWHEIQHGIAVATRERKLELAGVGVDTWGVDYGLLGADGLLLDAPRHYRDARTNGMMERVFDVVPRAEVFGYTGIQFMQLNTLYQLYAQHVAGSPALAAAKTLINMPDLFNYWLTGVARSEITIASTTQFFDPRTMQWSSELLGRLGIPTGILGELVRPGTRLGNMVDAPHAPVFATAGHDTAAAVAAVPSAGGDGWCYISSGTWSLMGLELDAPVINEQSLRLNFTNEVGAAGKIRLLKNIAGLWLLQECRRHWLVEGTEYSYAQLAEMAAAARPFSAIINPDAFLEPGEMPRKIAEHCRATGQQAAAHTGRIRTRHPGKPGTALPRGAGEPGSVERACHFHHPHCGRRIAQRRAQPVCGRLHGPARSGRTERSYGHRQRAGAGHGRGRVGVTGGCARRGAAVVRSGDGGAAALGRLGRRLPAVPGRDQGREIRKRRASPCGKPGAFYTCKFDRPPTISTLPEPGRGWQSRGRSCRTAPPGRVPGCSRGPRPWRCGQPAGPWHRPAWC